MKASAKRTKGRLGKVGLGTLAVFAIVFVVVVAGWKTIDFFILGPSAVRAAMGDVHDEIRNGEYRRYITLEQYWEEFHDHWINVMHNTRDEIVMRTSPPRREGAQIVITYSDSINLPSLPTFRHTFRITRDLKSW